MELMQPPLAQGGYISSVVLEIYVSQFSAMFILCLGSNSASAHSAPGSSLSEVGG